MSLGPPEGGIMFAHPVGTLIQNAEAKAMKTIERKKPFLMQGKLRAFVFYLNGACVNVVKKFWHLQHAQLATAPL